MNDAWLAALLAFGVTLVLMTVVDHDVSHFGTMASVASALAMASGVAGATAWREHC